MAWTELHERHSKSGKKAAAEIYELLDCLEDKLDDLRDCIEDMDEQYSERDGDYEGARMRERRGGRSRR